MRHPTLQRRPPCKVLAPPHNLGPQGHGQLPGGQLPGEGGDRRRAGALRRVFGVVLALGLSVAWAVWPPLAVAEETPPAEVLPEHRLLIQQLSDGSFAIRQEAARRLGALGIAAKPALLEAIESPGDLEVRLQAHRLLVAAMQADFEHRLTSFIEDDREAANYGLPAWPEFRELVGNSRSSRQLFAGMFRREGHLLQAFASKDSELAADLAQRLTEIRQSVYSAFGTAGNFSADSLATVLFISGNEPIRSQQHSIVGGRMIANEMSSLLAQQAVRERINGLKGGALKRLMLHWFEDARVQRSYYGIQLVLNYELREQGLKLARELVASPDENRDRYLIHMAAIVLAKFGDRSDVARLLPHLENDNVCHTWSNGKQQIKIQVRDVVLAMLVHLTGQQIKDYGFKLAREDQTTLYHVYTLGFEKNEERDEALKKWKTWSEKNL